MSAHVHAPAPELHQRRVQHCPTCKCRRRFFVALYAWYGARATCCACGDSWQDGEPCPRPFERGWRKKAAARAREAWLLSDDAREGAG